MFRAFVNVRAQMKIFGVRLETSVTATFIADRLINTHVSTRIDRFTFVYV